MDALPVRACNRRHWIGWLAGAALAPLACTSTAYAQPRDDAAALDAPGCRAQLGARLDAVLAGAWSDGQPGLSVLIRQHGVDLYRASRGSANSDAAPIDSATAFEIASLAKPVTAIAVMQLVEQGRLGLGDPLSRWLPALSPGWERITVRHLLANQSGIPDFLSHKTVAQVRAMDGLTNAQLLRQLAANPAPTLQPGSACAYSNTNYALLADVVGAVTGLPFARHVRSAIFVPCGMQASWFKGECRPAGIVQALNQAQSERTYGIELAVNGPFGLMSTVDDLSRLMRCWREGRLVSPATMQAMTVAQSGAPINSQGEYYGFGWYVPGPITRPSIYAHTGKLAGFRAMLRVDLPRHLELLALSNGGDATQALIEQMAAVLDGPYPAA